jgi:hypothetical protein
VAAKLPDVLDAIASDPAIDTLFFAFGAMARGGDDVARALVSFRGRTTKAVCVSWTFAPAEALAILNAAGVYHFPEPSRAIEALGCAANYATASRPRTRTDPLAFDWQSLVPDPVPGTVITEDACHRFSPRPDFRSRVPSLLPANWRPSLPRGRLDFRSRSRASRHKSRTGRRPGCWRSTCVASPRSVPRTGCSARAQAELKITLDGLYVQHMASGRLELLVSAFRDPVFGVIVACGAGGN